MNLLLFEMKRSLGELDMGLKGDLSITEAMEALQTALYDNRGPEAWAKRAYPSLRALAPWLFNMLERQKQLGKAFQVQRRTEQIRTEENRTEQNRPEQIRIE